jgi:hypothetical protein
MFCKPIFANELKNCFKGNGPVPAASAAKRSV